MAITDRIIGQAYSDLRGTCGGVREDYFGLAYFEHVFEIPRERAIVQLAFNGNDYGIDGFYIDVSRKILYLFQFKYSASHAQFKGSVKRLTDDGIERVFGAKSQDQHQNQLLSQLKSRLLQDQNLIEKVYIRFVFNGDPAEAERSQVLDKLREDLESKKYLIDAYFGRPMTMVFEFRSAQSGQVGPVLHHRATHTYPRDMKQRFFERNIRGSLK